ncbi:hypothetical protein K466DRAFT_582257 [Polyporus arcularius HHB13444]|uniref:Uncharacterized protein n=1 Tax=Polyporus arcularius HHB13444 TaxID=1314778 RepID=A0A5C3PRM2_9APHY|nr:hypothetical protein K466DRAFT_582257 [Polyporus arcularius HHB13444]
MPCYQKPAVRAAVGTYLRWRGKNLEWFEEDQRAVAVEFERCPCAACQVPEQDWAEEWVRGRIDVPVWYGEQRVTVEAGVSGKRGRRRKVEEADDDDEDDVDAGGDETELEDHDADEDSAGPIPRAVDAEDDDRLSPEPEEGVDEDEDEAPDVLLARAPARPVGPAEPSIIASEERTLSHPAAQPGPSAHAQAAAPPVVQEQRGQSRPALDYAPSTSTPSRPVSLHTGVPWMESPLEVYQRIYRNVSTSLAPVSAVVASSSMAPPSPDDGVDWGSLFN